MGYFILGDAITDNPASVIDETEELPNFDTNYGWQMKVRVVLKNNAEITDVGYYDDYGHVEVGPSQYAVGIEGGDERDGIMLTAYTAEQLQKHKHFQTCKPHLFELLNTYAGASERVRDTKMAPYAKGRCQNIRIVASNANDDDGDDIDPIIRENTSNITFFLDPSVEAGAQNKKRIQRLVNNFFKWAMTQKVMTKKATSNAKNTRVRKPTPTTHNAKKQKRPARKATSTAQRSEPPLIKVKHGVKHLSAVGYLSQYPTHAYQTRCKVRASDVRAKCLNPTRKSARWGKCMPAQRNPCQVAEFRV